MGRSGIEGQNGKRLKEKILTVVIPMYNVEQYIGQCLDSFVIPGIMDQIEVLVIDDGGTDNSARIAQEYENQYPDTYRLIHKANGGHGSTINKGIELASGKYFKVVDGDDWVDAVAFCNLIEHLCSTDTDMVLSNYYWVDHRTGKRRAEVPEICRGIQYGKPYIFDEISDGLFMKMHAITYKTEVIRNQPERLDEHCFYVDTEYMLFPLPYVKTVSAISEFVYQYRVGLPGQSMNITNMQKRGNQHEKVLWRLLEFYQKNGQEPYTDVLVRTLARIVTSQFKIYLLSGRAGKKSFIQLDKLLQREYFEIYKCIANPGVGFLRKTNYSMFWLVGCVSRVWVKLKHR